MSDRMKQSATDLESTPESTAYELATSVAKHMAGPARWTAKKRTLDEDGRRYAELTRAGDGAEIGVAVGGYRKEGRVTFRAHWPKYKDGQTFTPRSYPEITCSTARDPKALARELERRLLPDFDPAYQAALDEIRTSDARAAEAWRAAERIAEAIGAEPPREPRHRQHTNGAAVELRGGPSKVYGLKVHPAYTDTPLLVSFEVHYVDEETALQVLALLADEGDGAP
jgi:hypothetical protein